MNESENRIDYPALKAEYISSNLSLSRLAEKHGVSEISVKRRAAAEKWSEQRQRQAEKNGRKIAEKLNDKAVKDTVKDIEAVCRAARKLIKKANTAINQIDKENYTSYLKTQETAQESEEDGVTSIITTKKVECEKATIKTLIDTKKLEQISKSLLTIKQILTVDDESDGEEIGIVMMPNMDVLAPPESSEEEEQ